MFRLHCVLILGVRGLVLKETRDKIPGRLSIRDNETAGCGNLWHSSERFAMRSEVLEKVRESLAKRPIRDAFSAHVCRRL